MHFPQIIELVEEILSLIEDKNSLFACCQVSRLWNEIASKLLWRSITVSSAIPSPDAFFDSTSQQLANFSEQEMVERICNSREADRINRLKTLLLADNSVEKRIRKVTVKFEFVLEIQIGPLHYLEELDLSSSTKRLIWTEFMQRCRNILDLISELNNMSCLTLHVNLDFESRSLVEKIDFFGIFGRFLEYPVKEERSRELHLEFGEHAEISTNMDMIWDVLCMVGNDIKSFQIHDNAGLWLPSRLLHFIKLLGPQQRIALNNGARITTQVIDVILQSKETLKSLSINTPDFLDDEDFVSRVLAQCTQLRELCIQGGMHIWSRIDTGGFYSMMNCRKLEILKISGCTKLPLQFFKTLSQTCSSKLCILEARSANISEGALDLILGGCKSLKDLSVANCETLCGSAFANNIKETARLRNLDIVGCRRIYDAAESPSTFARIFLLAVDGLTLRVGPLPTSIASPGWPLLASIEEAVSSYYRNEDWDGKLTKERYRDIRSKDVRDMKNVVEAISDVRKWGLLPYHQLLQPI